MPVAQAPPQVLRSYILQNYQADLPWCAVMQIV